MRHLFLFLLLSVTQIMSALEVEVGNYIYDINESGEATLTGLKEGVILEGDVVIPSSVDIEGHVYKVTTVKSLYPVIGSEENYTKCTKLTFEDGIESIDCSLHNYNHCKEIVIPKSVKYLYHGVYYGGFSNGYYDETDPRIPADCFVGGILIQKMQDYNYFLHDTSFTVDPENKYYCSEDGVLYDKEKKTLLRCPRMKMGTFVVPEGVETLGQRSFQGCCFLKKIVLPSTVKNLGGDAPTPAVFNCTLQLEEINIPEGVTRLAASLFRITSLKHIKMPNTLKYLDASALSIIYNDLMTIDWQNCDLDTLNLYNSGFSRITMSLPQNVKYIGSYRENGTLYGIGILFGSEVIAPERLVIPASLIEYPTQFCSGKSESLANLRSLYVMTPFMQDIPMDYFGVDYIKEGKKRTSVFPVTLTENCTLYVPENLVGEYKSHAVWSKFKNIVGIATPISPVLSAGTIVTDANKSDLASYKMNIDTDASLSLNDAFNANLYVNDKLAGKATISDTEYSNNVLTINFHSFILNSMSKMMVADVITETSSEQVDVRIDIEPGSFDVNGVSYPTILTYRYKAPAEIEESIPTDVEKVDAVTTTVPRTTKRIINGRMVIEKQGKQFSISGAEMK